MKLSHAGQMQLTAQKEPFMVSFADLSVRFKERGIYPRDGRAVQVDGAQLLNTRSPAAHIQNYEDRINKLLIAVREAVAFKPTAFLRSEQGGRDSLEAAEKIAYVSRDPSELRYLAAMFINHRQVIQALASNPNIDEHTQRRLVTDPMIKNDVEVQRTLASNRGLKGGVMEIMLRESADSYVHREIAENAAQHSRAAEGAYTAICEALTKSGDSAIRQFAIGGVRDPGLLREIANSRSAFLAPRELEAVADNPFTSDDVLMLMASSGIPALQPVFSINVAKKARMSMAARSYHADLAHGSPTPA